MTLDGPFQLKLLYDSMKGRETTTVWGRYEEESNLQSLSAHCISLLCCSLLHPKCFSLLETSDYSVTFNQWFSHPSAMWCWAPMWPQCPCSGQHQDLLNPGFVSQPICLVPKQDFQFHHCHLKEGQPKGFKQPALVEDVSTHCRTRPVNVPSNSNYLWFCDLQPMLLSTTQSWTPFNPHRLPALVSVIATQGFPLIRFSDSAQGGHTDLPLSWVAPVPHVLSRSRV